MEDRAQPVTEAIKEEALNKPAEISTVSAAPQYEFTEPQNEVMKALEWKLSVLGSFVVIASIAVGIVFTRDLINSTFPFNPWYGVAGVVAAVLGLAHGIWLSLAATSFEKIHKTRGKDIDHLMDALNNLSKLFTLAAVSATLFFLWAMGRFIVSFFA